MPRPTVLIDKDQLTHVITMLESASAYGNMSALCKAVCETEWAKGVKNSVGKTVDLQPQVVYNRIQEFAIAVKTQPGKKGRSKGFKPTGTRKPRSERFSTNKLVSDAIDTLRKNVPHGHKKLVDKLAAGSLKAAVKLKCLDCVAYVPGEIGTESCRSCPLAAFVYVNLSKYKQEVVSNDDE